MQSVTAVICTYKRYAYLDLAIESCLNQQTDGIAFDVLVVDNTPSSPERDAAKAKYANTANLTYLTVDKPGLANARNVAAQTSQSDVIAFLDDDAIAGKGWAAGVAEAFAKHPDCAIAGGPIDPIYETPRPPWLHDKLLGYVTVIDWGSRMRPLKSGEWLAGANIAYRRESYLEAGGCNVALGRIGGGSSLLSNEETELTERLLKAGKTQIYAPKARVRHLVPADRMTRGWFRRRAMWQAISDQMIAPMSEQDALTHMKGVYEYVGHVPARDRSLRALFHDTDDAELFNWQMQAVYTFYRTSLSQGILPRL